MKKDLLGGGKPDVQEVMVQIRVALLFWAADLLLNVHDSVTSAAKQG